MADRDGEVGGSIHSSLLSLGGQEFANLANNLASECSLQLQRLRAILESPEEAEKLIRFLENLSVEQKGLLIGRVTLRLLRRITDFLEDMDGNKAVLEEMADNRLNGSGFASGNPRTTGCDWIKEVSRCRKPENSVGNGRGSIRRNSNVKKRQNYEWNEAVSDFNKGRQTWRDSDSALLLLLLSELQEEECLEAARKWQVDPLLYRRFIERDGVSNKGKSEIKNGLPSSRVCGEMIGKYLSENILKMGYSVPGLVGYSSLSPYIDIISRYQRLLRRLSGSENGGGRENPSAPASAATILSLPSVVFIGSEIEERQRLCSICGDDFESGMAATRLPCSHVYHWDCIHPWLKTRNTCPVCRHELPTDDIYYELHRNMRFLMQRAL